MFFGNDYNGLATCKVTQIVHFLRHEDKRSVAHDERIRRTGVSWG